MQFGATVRKIVEGETKPSDSDSKCTAVSKLPSKVAGYNDCAIAAKQKECKDTSTSTASTSTSAQDKQASNLRHMLIAMSEDWRVQRPICCSAKCLVTQHTKAFSIMASCSQLYRVTSICKHNLGIIST
eukprot:16437-Heterococcus_DN1.PRE.1